MSETKEVYKVRLSAALLDQRERLAENVLANHCGCDRTTARYLAYRGRQAAENGQRFDEEFLLQTDGKLRALVDLRRGVKVVYQYVSPDWQENVSVDMNDAAVKLGG